MIGYHGIGGLKQIEEWYECPKCDNTWTAYYVLDHSTGQGEYVSDIDNICPVCGTNGV